MKTENQKERMQDQQFANSNEAFEFACKLRGYNPVDLLPTFPTATPEWLKRHQTSGTKRLIIAEAINDGRVPKRDGKETVYFPVWGLTKDSAGLGLSHTIYGRWVTDTNVGARLEFFSRADSDYFRNNFSDLHADVLCYQQETEVASA